MTGKMGTTLTEAMLIARFQDLVAQGIPPSINDCRNILALVDRLSTEIHQVRSTVEAARILEPSFVHISTVLNEIMRGFAAGGVEFYSSQGTNGNIEWFTRRHNEDCGPFPNLMEAVQVIVDAG